MIRNGKKIRVGVVGADRFGRYWGARAHIPAVRALSPLYELVAVCTAHEETASIAKAKYSTPMAFSDYHEMVSNSSVDLVTIATRVKYHDEISRAALEAGKMVFCEWPLCLNSSEARTLASLAEKNALLTAVGTQGRFLPAFLHFCDLIRNKQAIGDPLFFRVSHLLPKFQVWSDHEWPTKEEEGNSVLYVATAHCFDLVRVSLSDPEKVLGTKSTLVRDGRFEDTGARFEWTAADTVQGLIQLRNGIQGSIVVSHAAIGGEGFRMEVYGTRGRMSVASQGYVCYSPMRVYGGGRREDNELPIPKELFFVNSLDDTNPAFSVAQLLTRFARSSSKAVLESSNGFPQFHPDFEDGYRLHRIIEALELSSKTNKWEKVAE